MGGHAGIPVAVQVIVARGDEVLLMLRRNTGYFDGLYALPGGHVEEGETLAEAAARELEEEVGLVVPPARLVACGCVHRHSDANRLDFFFRAVCWDGEPTVREPDRCGGLRWDSPQQLPQDTVPFVRDALSGSAMHTIWLRETGFHRLP